MTIRNIDVINSLIPVCARIDELGYGEECMCPECRSQSPEHSKSDFDFIAAMSNQLMKAQSFLEKLSTEYAARFEEFEIDYEDMMQTIACALESPQHLCANLEIIHEHMDELWELCESEVEYYLLMTHPGNHNDLLHIEILFNGGDCSECGTVCRTAAESIKN